MYQEEVETLSQKRYLKDHPADHNWLVTGVITYLYWLVV